MQALQTVTVQHERAASPRQVRISAKVKVAIEKMVDHALKRTEAAQIAGLTDHALYCALRQPHVIAYRNERMRVLRESEASRTIARAVALADDAESEHVRLQANTWIAGLESIAPVQRTENMHVHQHVIPGLTVVREGWSAHDPSAHLIDGQAREVRSSPVINRIGTSVPHPEAGNVSKSEALPGNVKVPAKATRGAK